MCLNITWHALLGDLTVIDLLLKSVIRNQSVNVAWLLLPVAVHSTHSLGIMARVPRSIKHNDSVCSNEVNTQTPSTGNERQISNCCLGQFSKLLSRDNHHSQESMKSPWTFPPIMQVISNSCLISRTVVKCCRGLRLKFYIPREFRSRWHYHLIESWEHVMKKPKNWNLICIQSISVRVLHSGFLLQPTYRVDKRKSQTEVLLRSLNWLISRSLSEAEVLPSSPEKEIKDTFKSSVCLGESHQNKPTSQTLSFVNCSQPITGLPQVTHSRTSALYL